MHIRCPHRHNPIDAAGETSLKEIVCPSYGSSFGLIAGDTTESQRAAMRRLAHFELARELGEGNFSRGFRRDWGS